MPHSARAILSRSSAVRTECQSATGRRRSMEKKSSSGTGAVGGSCAGSWQCIRSARDRPSASARGSSVLMSGRPTPRSQRPCRSHAAVRPARPGSGPAPCAPGQEKPRTFLRPCRSHPFPQNSRLVWKTQPTERLPTLLKENERASCKNILTKSYDDTILKAKEGRWLQIGQLLTGIMSKRLTARLGNRGGQSFLLLE